MSYFECYTGKQYYLWNHNGTTTLLFADSFKTLSVTFNILLFSKRDFLSAYPLDHSVSIPELTSSWSFSEQNI